MFIEAITYAGKAMNTWNYRVIRHEDGSLGIHEVHYENGVPHSMTADPTGAMSVPDNVGDATIDGLRDVLYSMRRALGEPILHAKDFHVVRVP